MIALVALLLATDLVGPESCRACHAAAYEAWKNSPHARAAKVLTAEQQKQQLCLQCHSRDDARGIAPAAGLSGVSCETCHGAGRWYQPAVVMRDKELARYFGLVDVTPASCKVCHGGEEPSMTPFDVDSAMKKIDHWTADRAARRQPKQAQAAAPRTQLAQWLKQDGK
jgi:hypothetical protein